jgi:LacI family transcriptional regulator
MLRVLFALNIEQVFDRRAFGGLAGAARHYGDMLLHQKEPSETFSQAVRRHGAEGIILSSDSADVVAEAVATHKPCVNIANHLAGQKRAPVVGTDDAAIGTAVAEHFLERGFRSFAFYSNLRLHYFDPRQQAFVKAITDAGFTCAVGPEAPGRARAKRTEDPKEQLDWVDRAGRWLASLPKPLAVMAPHDSYGRDAIQACHVAGLSVPGEVSVIGVDNDDLTCLAVSPQLSSIDTHAARVGSEAIDLVRAMVLNKQPIPQSPKLIAPGDIVVRGSSSESAVEDQEVAGAIKFIRSNVGRHITVEHVVDHVLISRRSLERRFYQMLSRSVMDEIRRSRLDQAKRLLARTDLSLDEVARRSGLLRQQRLSSVIREATGLTPGQYRKSFRYEFEADHRPV